VFLNEEEGKRLFTMLGIPVPRGGMAASPEQAAEQCRQLAGPVMVKALVETGKRGLAGGIKTANGPAEAARAADEMLGTVLNGQTVAAVRVEERVSFKRELYMSVTLDRSQGCLVALVGQSGGVHVEQKNGGGFAMAPIPSQRPFGKHSARELVYRAGLSGRALVSSANILYALVEGAKKYDLLLAEINPLFLLGSGELIAGDAKVTVDDDAIFRQRTWIDTVRPHADWTVDQDGLRLIPLGGNIGVLSGGAGLGLATMDSIVRAGGKPANFLDVGGGVTETRIVKALEMIASQKVDGILVNVFGGINNCAIVASGVLRAWKSIPIDMPLVVRFRGHFEEEGWALLESAGINVAKRGTTREAAERLLVLMAANEERASNGDSA
jgi:succinyl-CoA synthetase beta subunit